MIAPAAVRFNSDQYILGNSFRAVYAVRSYGTSTEELALLRDLGCMNGVTLTVYARRVGPAEEDSILHNATNKNRMNQKAKTVWGEARGCSVTQQAAVAWCILNRVDSAAFPNSIRAVVTQKYQFAGYCSSNPVELEILALVYDVLARWSLESEYAGSVGRVLPQSYLYFTGNGVKNTFTETFLAKTAWDWSLPSPYETGGKEASPVRILVPCLSC